MITKFHGNYRWLSNFTPCKVTYDGIEYDCIENAYQASKTLNLEDRLEFQDITPWKAKRLGSNLEIRNDWEHIKVPIMRDLLIQKFAAPAFKKLLLATGRQEIQEGNLWNDTFWGFCLSTNKGKNILGKLIMEIRDSIWVYNEEPEFNFDLKRMEKALEGPFITMPEGLTREEARNFIISTEFED
jgi:ribA/ribD-fused uncharacterized protein